VKYFYIRALICLCLPIMLLACRNESTQEAGMYTSYQFPDTATVVKTTESNLYNESSLAGKITSYYLEGYDGVPFITGTMFATIWQILSDVSDENFTLAKTDSTLTITRIDTTPNVSLTIDAAAQTFSSANFMQFCTAAASFNNGCALLSNDVDGFCAVKNASATTASSVTFDINTTYGLKMYPYTDSSGNKEILIPAQLAGLVLCSADISFLSYNGNNYYINPALGGTMSDSYLAGYGRGGTRTRAEAEFNYRLLCMLFDKYYSLQHLRTRDMNNGFNTFVYSNDLDQKLLSADPAVYDDALVKTLMTYVDDGHTSYLYPSYYEKASEVSYFQKLRGQYQGSRYNSLYAVRSEMVSVRKTAFSITDSEYAGGLRYINNPETNTPAIAVITFDEFKRSTDVYYSDKLEITAASPEFLARTDSFELFYNALNTIQAYNADSSHTEKIHNIIIDESCNGGGSADACVYLANVFIKNAKLCYRNQLDGTQNTVSYDVDTDLDGSVSTVTDWDLSSLHVYVLTSECSFSCGNLFPEIMKEQRDNGMLNVASIQIIGKQSGGGGAIVLPAGTGDGALFSTSSAREMTYTDGTSIDGGVPVDLKLEHSVFYNDTAMYNALHDKYTTNF
jgi:hypothetical protein